MTQRACAVVTVAGLALLLGGCTSASEREAFSEYRALSHQSYPLRRESQAEGELPQLTDQSQPSDYLAYAALNNPALEAAFNRWKAALERVPQARSLPDPRFTYRYFIEQVETRVGPQRQSFELAQTFPWFGKLELRSDVALQAANAARQRYEAEKLKLFYRVKDAYCEYAYWSQAVDITRQNRDLLSYLEQVATTRYKAAAGGHPDVIRAQVELGRMEDRLLSLVDLKSVITARLNAALGRPVGAELPAAKTPTTYTLKAGDDQILQWLQESNPELRALAHEIAREEKAMKLARKDYAPDVTLGVQYVDTGPARMPGVPDSGQDPVLAMFSINVPIWYDKLSAAQREARARYWADAKDKEDRRNSLSAEIKMVLYQVRDAERKINLYRDTLIPKAEQSLKVTEAAFRAGTSTFLDLLESQRVLLDFQLSLQRALANHAQRVAQLEMLVGRAMPGITYRPPPEDASRLNLEQ